MLFAIISYTLIIVPFSGGRVPYFLSGVALPAAAVCSALIQFVGDQGKVCHLQISAAVKIFKIFHIGVSFQMKSDFLFIGSTIREPVGFCAYGGRSRECGGALKSFMLLYTIPSANPINELPEKTPFRRRKFVYMHKIASYKLCILTNSWQSIFIILARGYLERARVQLSPARYSSA